MLVMKTDVTLLDRMTVAYADDLLASGVQGTWAAVNSSNKAAITTTATIIGASYAVWSESYADGTQGWAPEVAASGKVTLLNGKYRAVTDQVSSATYASASVGSALAAGDNGKLVAAPDTATGAKATVAYVKRKIASFTHRGTTYTEVLEILVV